MSLAAILDFYFETTCKIIRNFELSGNRTELVMSHTELVNAKFNLTKSPLLFLIKFAYPNFLQLSIKDNLTKTIFLIKEVLLAVEKSTIQF